MIRTKSIYAPKSDDDGLRICVMSRLTENDGRTPLQDLVKGTAIDYWAKLLAPPPKLVGAWYRSDIEWQNFESQYVQYLNSDRVNIQVNMWTNLGLTQNLTFLCVESSPQFCHRRILAEECRRRNEFIGLDIQ